MAEAYHLPGQAYTAGKKDESNCPALVVCASNEIGVRAHDTVYCLAAAGLR